MRLACYQPSSNALSKFFSEDAFFGTPQGRSWSPDLDVIEEKDQYVLKADLPGLKKEDIKISVENGILSIAGQRDTEAEYKDKQVHFVERSYGRFARTLNLGVHVDYNKIQATYKDGVLEVSVPKAEAAKPKAIDIQVS